MARKSKKSASSSSRHLLQDISIDPSLRFRVEEAYKSIRANIMFSIMKKGCKTIVVSSASPNEGKTTTTINLAITLSQADQKVLLIETEGAPIFSISKRTGFDRLSRLDSFVIKARQS